MLPAFFLTAFQSAMSQCSTSTIVNNTNCTTPNGKIAFTAPTPTANYLFCIDGGNTFGAVGQRVFTRLLGGDYPTVSKNIASGWLHHSTSCPG